MTLSPQWLDELRARTLLSAVIAPSVKLIKAGREFKACCPFHSEKTPSFTVNDEKGFYHCFGCGAHGDAIRFLTDAKGLPFMDAVKELAAKAGMVVPAVDSKSRERAEKSAGLHEVMEAAAKWFAEQLDGVEGGAARNYLKERGISDATKKRFGFGFAPDSRGKLKKALENFGIDKLVEAGLLIQTEEKKEPYDRFRGRLTYPIKDARGRVIAFSARILGPGEPKYLNSPDTPLFDKGRTLFNLDLASPASRTAQRVIIVEGQMDVIALDQAGIGEVVAPLGTALTEAQLERLWRLDGQPICCFDGDSAGQKAAIRAALRALPHLSPERTLRFVALPPGADPDDVVRQGGKAAFEALLAEAQPLVERLWQFEVGAAPLDTPEARAGLRKRLLEHAQAIADPNVRQLYRDEWLGRFDREFRPQQQERRPFVPRAQWSKKDKRFVPPEPPASQAARAIGKVGIDAPTAQALIAGFSYFPELAAEHVEDLTRLAIPDRLVASFRDRLLDAAQSRPALDKEMFESICAEEGLEAELDKLRRTGAYGFFSFTRQKRNPEQAKADLALTLETALAKAELDDAIKYVTQRLVDGDENAFSERQRLDAAREALNERLASLAGSD